MTAKQKQLDLTFMQQALDLAKKGLRQVSPNPMVGCVIVKSGKVIGQGYHKKFGGAHAEVNALKSVKSSTQNSTVYVTLEPCAHFGKTPPCVNALIEAGVKRVVIAMKDPNPLTKGKSIRKLKAKGIEVVVGVCEKEAKFLNRVFICNQTKGRPYVIVKIAQSLDGKIAAQKGKQTWLTGKEAVQYVHKLRSLVDAVMVGAGTIKADNPQLNVRFGKKSHSPQVVVLDGRLSTSPKAKCFHSSQSKKFVMTSVSDKSSKLKTFQKQNIETLCLPEFNKGPIPIPTALQVLYQNQIGSVLVEGGAEIFNQFAKHPEFVDEWQFIIAPIILGKGPQALTHAFSIELKPSSIKLLGVDQLIQFKSP